MNPLICETQKARLFYFVISFVSPTDNSKLEREIMERETKNFVRNLTEDELIELYYDSTFENFRYKTKYDAAIVDDSFLRKYVSAYMRNQEKRQQWGKLNVIKEKMGPFQDKTLWALDMTQEKADAEIASLQTLYDNEKALQRKIVVYPQPVPDIHPKDIDFKKIDKDKFFTFYKANRILYTRGHERVRSDLYLEEMTRLLDVSLKNDIISGVLLYERYAEVSGNPISKKHLAAVKELKRKSNYDTGTFFPIK